MLENKSKGEKSYIILRYGGKQPHNQVGKMIEDKNEIETNTWKQKKKKKLSWLKNLINIERFYSKKGENIVHQGQEQKWVYHYYS